MSPMHTRLVMVVLALSLSGCASSTDGDPAASGPVFENSIFIEAGYDAVWYRFTTAGAYAAWYSSACREFGERPGDRCIWGDQNRLFYEGRLLAIEKGTGLSHTFAFVGFGIDEPETRVDIGIKQQGPTVLVTVRHDCSRSPKTGRMITPVGWQKSLSRLKTLLETGKAMAWPLEDG